MMANERRVSASTHNQALSAILFLYREVLNIDLPWLNHIGRPQQAKRIPAVLTRDEVRRPFGANGGHHRRASTSAISVASRFQRTHAGRDRLCRFARYLGGALPDCGEPVAAR